MKTDQLFRVGVVGAGNISQFHLQVLSRIEYTSVVGIVDLDKDAASERAEAFGIPYSGDSLSELIEQGIDVVHIVTPPSTHAQLSIQAMEAGCHVIVEKPMATSVEDCRGMAEAASRTGKYLTVNHSLLFDPFIVKAKAIVESGKIGEVVAVDYFRSSDYPSFPAGKLPPQYRDGGYPFRDIGIHWLYLAEHFLGEITDASANFDRMGGDPYLFADEWRCQAKCRQGTSNMWLSWNNRPLQNRLIIHGTKGLLEVDLFSMSVLAKAKLPGPELLSRVINPLLNAISTTVSIPWNVFNVLRGKIRRFHGVQSFVEDFYLKLQSGTPPAVTPEEAIRVVEWNERLATPADRAKTEALKRYSNTGEAKVLVTGGTGFIGRQLLRHLTESGQNVRLLVRRIPKERQERVEYVIGDLGDSMTVNSAMQGIETVFHLGAGMQGALDDFVRSTINGTENVVAAALDAGVQKLIYISSLSVLHALATNNGPIDESWPLEPQPKKRGAYTQTKLEAEGIVTRAVKEQGLPAAILRPGQVFGEEATPMTGAVGRRMGPFFVVFGNGKTPLPLIYVEDLIQAILLVAEQGDFSGKIYHATDTTEKLTQNDLAEAFLSIRTDSPKIFHLPRPAILTIAKAAEILFKLLGKPVSIGYRIDSSIQTLHGPCTPLEALGWQPEVGVKKGLQRVKSAERDR